MAVPCRKSQGGVSVVVGSFGVGKRANAGKAAQAAFGCRVGERGRHELGGRRRGADFDGGEHGRKVVGQDGVEEGRSGRKGFGCGLAAGAGGYAHGMYGNCCCFIGGLGRGLFVLLKGEQWFCWVLQLGLRAARPGQKSGFRNFGAILPGAEVAPDVLGQFAQRLVVGEVGCGFSVVVFGVFGKRQKQLGASAGSVENGVEKRRAPEGVARFRVAAVKEGGRQFRKGGS